MGWSKVRSQVFLPYLSGPWAIIHYSSSLISGELDQMRALLGCQHRRWQCYSLYHNIRLLGYLHFLWMYTLEYIHDVLFSRTMSQSVAV